MSSESVPKSSWSKYREARVNFDDPHKKQKQQVPRTEGKAQPLAQTVRRTNSNPRKAYN